MNTYWGFGNKKQNTLNAPRTNIEFHRTAGGGWARRWGKMETKNDFSNEKHKTFSVECRSTGEYVLERHRRELNSHGNRNGAQTQLKKPCIELHSCAMYMYLVVSRVGVVIRFMLLPSSMHRRNVLFSVFRQNIFGWLRFAQQYSFWSCGPWPLDCRFDGNSMFIFEFHSIRRRNQNLSQINTVRWQCDDNPNPIES